MTLEIAFVLLLILVAVALFATERLPADLVALLVMVALLLSGVLDPAQGMAGFANTATVTVGAMFVLSAGLVRTGAVRFAGRALLYLAKRSLTLTVLGLMLGVAVFSAFLNNTAAVAILIPVVIGVARKAKTSASKLLMPLSFASMFGGVATLIGTSTNLLGAAIAERHGQPAFGMFDFLPLGLVFVVAGTAYMLLIGTRLIPERRGEGDLTETFAMADYLTEVVLLEGGKSVGKRLDEAPLLKAASLEVLALERRGRVIYLPGPHRVLRAGDILRVKCAASEVAKLHERDRISFERQPSSDDDLAEEEHRLVEAVMAPSSPMTGKTVRQVGFREQYGAAVLALRHRGELMRGNVKEIILRGGDALLLDVPVDQLPRLVADRSFVVVSDHGPEMFRKSKVPIAVAIVAAVVIGASLGVVPIVIGSVAGGLLMVLSGCIKADEAYDAIEWRVLFLLAGLLALGAAMETTGAARLLADGLVDVIGPYGPRAVLSGLFLITMVLTSVMSNNATVALLAPIAIVIADTLDVSARPFLMGVMFAGSSSFMTPVGYQTNTMIYGPGQYRFADFLKVGGPLSLLFWLIASVVIPFFWPFS